MVRVIIYTYFVITLFVERRPNTLNFLYFFNVLFTTSCVRSKFAFLFAFLTIAQYEQYEVYLTH